MGDITRNLAIIIFCVGLCLSSGCSDSPENKASKEVRQEIQDALASVTEQGLIKSKKEDAQQVDVDELYAKARKQLSSAISKSRNAKSGIESAYLVNANLAFEHAQYLLSQTGEAKVLIRGLLDEISRLNREAGLLTVERDRIEGLVAGIKEEIEVLKQTLAGDAQNTGVTEQLARKNSELQKLEQLKKKAQQQFMDAKASENDIQAKADEKFRASEAVSGDEKLKLERQGYEILLSKKNYIRQAQAAQDQVRMLDDQISVLKQEADKLESDIERIEQKIEDTLNAKRQIQLQEQARQVADKIDESEKQISQQLTLLSEAQQKYNQDIETISSYLSEAAENYKKIKMEGVSATAKALLGDCYSQLAELNAGQMRFSAFVGQSILSSSQAGTEQAAGGLASEAQKYAEGISEYAKKAMDNFEEAAKAYEGAQKSAGKTGQDFAEEVTKSYLLILNSMKLFAEMIENYKEADKAAAKIDEVVKSATEKFGPAFAKTTAMKIATGESDFVPQLPVNNKAFYEQIKKQLQGYKSLPVSEREAAVNQLIVTAEQLKLQYNDPELDAVINPEIEKLKEALEKGFVEETSTVTVDRSDPNSV